MSAIPQWKKDRCQWCAEGTPRFEGLIKQHVHLNQSDRCFETHSCTAPTESAYIADLQAKLAEAEKEAHSLDLLRVAAELDYDDSEKRAVAAESALREALNLLEILRIKGDCFCDTGDGNPHSSECLYVTRGLAALSTAAPQPQSEAKGEPQG